MKLDFNLQVTQKQGIALTAQVQQAIKLLHMTNMEIQDYVDDQFQDNPFVETTGEFGEEKNAEKTDYSSKVKKETKKRKAIDAEPNIDDSYNRKKTFRKLKLRNNSRGPSSYYTMVLYFDSVGYQKNT